MVVFCLATLLLARVAGALPLRAVCILAPDGNSTVRGAISFQQDQEGQPTRITATVKGLDPSSKHGFHVHQLGDLTMGCSSAGAHYNPTSQTHGGPADSERHYGDLGSIVADSAGLAVMNLTDTKVALLGQFSVLGRSCVVHAKEDDLGRGDSPDSKTTGNSGPRLACGVIGLAKQFMRFDLKGGL